MLQTFKSIRYQRFRYYATWDSRPLPATPMSPFPNEYESAKMRTKVPGPESVRKMKQLDKIQNTSVVHFFADYVKSRGNYIVDVDGNRYLDVLGQIASLPMGYNHPKIIRAMQDPENLSLLTQRPCLGILPPDDWFDRVNNTLMAVAPKGLPDVVTMMCGSCSNENAFKAAFIWYQTKLRDGKGPTEEEMESCMRNAAPGSPNLSVLSFQKGFHGRLLGCMSATHSKSLHKVDMPAFDWPVVDFPRLKYPLAEFEKENKENEQQCLEKVEQAIVSHLKHSPIAAMIVEPIQAEGGDNHASVEFFTSLRNMAADHGVAFIVDEVQTGAGSTGKFWAHQHWNLDNPPDLVTFSKKMQTGGYYCKREFRPEIGYRIFNTWMGDPSKMIQLQTFVDACTEDQLLENTIITGKFLKQGLDQLAELYPEAVSEVRGSGTYLAITLSTPEKRDELVETLRQHGVESTGSGDKSLRFRPALIFEPKHATELLNVLDFVIKKMYR